MGLDVALEHVSLERGERPVLRDVSWRIEPGERWVLVGANGAGKTQLLKIVAGAVWPTPDGRGRISWRWKRQRFATPAGVADEIAYLGPERQDRYERYEWNHRVLQIVGTGIHRTDIPLDRLTARDIATARRWLSRLGVLRLAERRFLTLSYGERRLVLLARALASRPTLLLLDELLNGLDSRHRVRVLRLLERAPPLAPAWVLATHRADDVPSTATHALVLEGGVVSHRGPIADVPLAQWLRAHDRTAHDASPPRARAAARSVPVAKAPRAAPIVALDRACLYLDYRLVLRDLTFDVRPGDCWVVHGANGSGKTTLLRAIYGDWPVAAGGSIRRAGIASGVPIDVFKRRVGLVAPHLQAEHPQYLTVEEVAMSGRYASVGLNDAPSARDRAAARSALREFGLVTRAKNTLRELSYGQLRRLLFARALVNRPRLLLLDEPYTGLDPRTRAALARSVDALVARGIAVLIATHHTADWPSRATHEIELRAHRAEYAGPVRTRVR